MTDPVTTPPDGLTPETVPEEWVKAAEVHYFTPGAGLIRNILAGVYPLIATAERERTLAMLRRAAAGKREYASRGGPDDITARMEMAALGYESAADLITDPRHILDVIPSWQWTEAERASLYEKDGA